MGNGQEEYQDAPWCIKLNQNCVSALHESVIVVVGQNQHSILFFHLCAVILLLLLIVTVLFIRIRLLLCNISQQTRKGHRLISGVQAQTMFSITMLLVLMLKHLITCRKG